MSQAKSNKTANSTAKAALLFGSGTLTSRILGLFRDTLVYSIMPYDMRDAWIAAFRIPNFFRRLLGEGGLSVSFIPVYVDRLKNGQIEDRQKLANGVFTLLMSLVSIICLLCFVFMDSIVGVWLSGPGFTEVPGKLVMTVSMARVMIFFLFFISLFAYFMALLNANKKFTMSGYAPLFLNLGIIVGLLIFKNSEELPMAAAYSVVVGVAMQALFLLYPVIKNGLLPRLSSAWNSPDVRKVLNKFMPTFLGVGILQVLGLINTYFASQLAPGTLSHINLGDRLLELPLSLIAVSIGTTLLPTLSGFWAAEKKQDFMECLEKHFKLFYFLALPAAFGLWFLGEEITAVLFKRGEFNLEEVIIVAGILKIYCVTLMAAGSLKIFNQAFYATGDTKTPAFIALFGLCVHLVMAPILMKEMALTGLIISTASVSVINLLIGSTIIQKRIAWISWGKIAKHFSCCFMAATAMGGYLYVVNLYQWQQGRFIFDMPVLLGIIAFGGMIYFMVAGILKVDELQSVLKRFKRKAQ